MRNSASSLSMGGKKDEEKNAVGIVCLVVSKLCTRILYGKDKEYRGGFEVNNMFTDVCQEQINK